MDRMCKSCEQTNPLDQFPVTKVVKGKKYYRHICRKCKADMDRKTRAENSGSVVQKGGYFEGVDSCVKAMNKRWVK